MTQLSLLIVMRAIPATPCRLFKVIGPSGTDLRRFLGGSLGDPLARLLAAPAGLVALGGGEQPARRQHRVRSVDAAHGGVTAGDRADRVHDRLGGPEAGVLGLRLLGGGGP